MNLGTENERIELKLSMQRFQTEQNSSSIATTHLLANLPAIRQQSRTSASIIIENWSSLDKNEQAVCRYLETRTTARPASISEDLGIKRRTLGDVLNRLIEKRIIVAGGESVSRAYSLRRLKENSNSDYRP